MLWDEATASIDPHMEKEILTEIIEQVKEEKKFLLAATHRVDTLPLFQEVWFIKDGTVFLQGPHDKLLLEPIYREFFEKK